MMMISKVLKTVEEHMLLQSGDRVVVAFSGGADSCALLLCLKKLAENFALELTAAHFNHGLRANQSEADEEFCRALAEKIGVSFVTERLVTLDVPRGMSPEDYFRRQRYQFLERVAVRERANKIALGHHLQDQAETVLINILRGSGLDGLKGIVPIRNGKFIRPLIAVSKEEILGFLQDRGIDYRFDSSNDNWIYLRNRIRGELIPLLKNEYNPQIEYRLSKMAEIIRRDDDYINRHVENILNSEFVQIEEHQISLFLSFFQTLHISLKYRLVKAILETLVGEGKGFSFSHIQSIVELADKGQSGKKLSIPYGLCVQKSYDVLIFETVKMNLPKDYEYPIIIPGDLAIPERGINLLIRRSKGSPVDFKSGDCVCFDAEKIREPLVIRNRRTGDRFTPLGTKGSQKIKKLFIDRKIPRGERAQIAVMADQESVIWIENLHLNDRVKVTPETKEILTVRIEPLN